MYGRALTILAALLAMLSKFPSFLSYCIMLGVHSAEPKAELDTQQSDAHLSLKHTIRIIVFWKWASAVLTMNSWF